MILMCKNQKVYNTENEEVYNEALLPGYMKKLPCNPAFRQWMKYRYSSGTNTIARRLKGITFGQGNRKVMNERTHALSFGDCYWVKEEPEILLFEEISPYYAPFWDGSDQYRGEAVPTLYVGGALSKEWKKDGLLYKYGRGVQIEAECAVLCQNCGLECEKILPAGEDAIAVVNFTSPRYMLEQADASGRIDPDDFTEEDIIRLFGEDGAKMLVFDAIIGNGDRHAGNFGWLRDADTGDYVKMAPLYDFDHALDVETAEPTDRLICDMLEASAAYTDLIARIAEKAATGDYNPVFKHRAELILQKIAR